MVGGKGSADDTTGGERFYRLTASEPIDHGAGFSWKKARLQGSGVTRQMGNQVGQDRCNSWGEMTVSQSRLGDGS